MSSCESPNSPNGEHKGIPSVSNRGFNVMKNRETVRDGRPCTEIRIDKYGFRNVICKYCGLLLAEGFSRTDAIFIDTEYQYAYK